MKSLILAGGLGTRLRDIVGDIPKPMVSIAGKPFLEHQIKYLVDNGVEDIVLAVHYKAEAIKSHFANGLRFNCNITYSEEDTPLGTGGAIKLAQKYIGDNTFLVLNGDSYCDINLNNFRDFHNSKKSLCSLVLNEVKDSVHYGSAVLDKDKITKFNEKISSGLALVNSGMYLFNSGIFDYIHDKGKVSLEREIFPELVKQGQISGLTHNGYFMDIGRPETYRQFKKDFINRLKSTRDISVREALSRIEKNGAGMLFVVDEKEKFSGVLTNNILNKYLINGGDLDKQVTQAMIKKPARMAIRGDSKKKIHAILREGIKQLPILDSEGGIYDVRFRVEEVRKEEYPTLRGRTPLRISFAGGGTDIPDFFEEHGGAVISTTIDKYCNITAKKRGDSKLVIDSDMANEEVIFDASNLQYDGNFDLVKSVYNLVNPGFGLDLYLNNDVPAGRGLGSSASFAVLLTKMISKLKGEEFDDEMLAETAYVAETQELGIRGGKQDQYAAVFGGFNWIEFGSGDKKIMHPLRIREDTLNELRAHLTLCYTGKEHKSIHQQEKCAKQYKENPREALKRLGAIKENAKNIKEYLLSSRPSIENIGDILHQSWQNKKKLSAAISSPEIDNLYEAGIKNGIYGGKLLGSGGGGYILFFHPPKIRNGLERALVENGGEILNFNFDNTGAKVWNVK